ncbi:hypothetical protein [Maribacter sp. LLG6340-A2]|uniref:hypothetical protein n=1 Tax=Maribacter sp. LLG6340-A2 TaxID=3160834 RepID=UPI0038651070
MKSTFTSDLNKERKLSILLDAYYKKYLTKYSTKRIVDMKKQLAGIDIVFTHKQSKAVYYIDEKAQLDYINDDLPTFAFELTYFKRDLYKEGWLFDDRKKTDFYALVTAIYEDEPSRYTTCKITMVNRQKLCSFLKEKKITKSTLATYYHNAGTKQGKLRIRELDHRTEGYLYFSTIKKVEKPVNLILRLDYLIENGLAKRLA